VIVSAPSHRYLPAEENVMTLKLCLSVEELKVVWNALQAHADNSEDVEGTRWEFEHLTALKLVHRIEGDLIPILEGAVP
jgi:hypothetical protein